MPLNGRCARKRAAPAADATETGAPAFVDPARQPTASKNRAAAANGGVPPIPNRAGPMAPAPPSHAGPLRKHDIRPGARRGAVSPPSASLPHAERGNQTRAPCSTRTRLSESSLINLQTHNLRGLNESSLQSLLQCMQTYNIFAYFVQEHWRCGHGAERVRDCVFLYNGLQHPVCPRGSQGVGIFLSPEAVQAWERAGAQNLAYGERLLATRVHLTDAKGKLVKLVLASGYAPSFLSHQKSDAALESYYREADRLVQDVAADEILVWGADTNASLGHSARAGAAEGRVTGSFGNPHRNHAGAQLRRFCASNDLCAASTFFQKRRYDTWRHPRSKRMYQLDHFLVPRTHLKRVADCFRPALNQGPDSDHMPVVLRLRVARNLRRWTSCHTAPQRSIINRLALQTPAVAAEFRALVLSSYSANLAESTSPGSIADANQKYSALANALASAADSVLSEDVKPTHTWYHLRESALDTAIEQRAKAQAAYFDNKDPCQAEILKSHLRAARKVVKREVELTKKLWFVTELNKLETFQHPRTYWSAFRQLKRGVGEGTPLVTPAFKRAEDPEGPLTATTAQHADAAGAHFKRILNIPAEFDPSMIELVRQRPTWDGGARPDFNAPPSRALVKEVLKKVKTGTAPGPDGLPPELWKALVCVEEPEAFDVLMDVLTSIWCQGAVPPEWRHNKLVFLYKNKGEKSALDNYRGIMLKPLANKIMGACLQVRLSEILKSEGLPEQFGFTPGLGGDEARFCLLTCLQKRAEHGLGSWVAYIDLVKAFDSVPREALWLVLAKFGVPPAMAALICDMHTNVDVELRVAMESRSFSSTTGVLQGSSEAPVLFLMYIQACLEVYDMGRVEEDPTFLATDDLVLASRPTKALPPGTKSFSFHRSLFADDGAFVWTSRQDLETGLQRLFGVLRDFGLSMHVGTGSISSKTVCMYFPPAQCELPADHPTMRERRSRVEERTAPCANCRRVGKERCRFHRGRDPLLASQYPLYHEADLSDVQVGHGTVPFEPEFKYLGSIIHYSLEVDREIEARIDAAAAAFGAARTFLCDRRLPLKERVRMFSVHVVSTLLVGVATWNLNTRHVHKLGVFYRTCVRRLLGVSRAHVWKEGVTSYELLQLAGLPDLEETMIKRRLGFIGKLCRRSDSTLPSLPRLFLSSWVNHPRPPGRPKTGTPASYLKDLAVACIEPDALPSLASHRSRWRAYVKNLKLQTSVLRSFDKHCEKHNDESAAASAAQRRARCRAQQEHRRRAADAAAAEAASAAAEAVAREKRAQPSAQRQASSTETATTLAPAVAVTKARAPCTRPAVTSPPPAPMRTRAGRSVRVPQILDL